MPPGAEQAIEAASHSGWEAVVIVILLLTGSGFFAVVIKFILDRHTKTEERILSEASNRENRLSERVTKLEDMIHGELLAALKTNSETMGRVLNASEAMIRAAQQMSETLARFVAVLDVRPCLLPSIEQRRVIAEMEKTKHGSNPD